MADSRKPHYRRKKFADISYISRAIANFVLNFVAMATRVAQGKIRLASFDGPSPKTHYGRKNLADISYTNRVIVNFVPKFVAMATRVTRREI